MIRTFILFIVFCFAGLVHAADIIDPRAQELFKEIRCVVCQSQSLNDSAAPMAEDMKLFIIQEIDKGKTNAEIKKELVTLYGDGILMTPPVNQKSYVLWLTPLVLLIIGGFSIVRLFKRSAK